MTRKYLDTGGAGFKSSNFIRYLLSSEPRVSVTNVDALKYAGVWATVEELDTIARHHFIHGDTGDRQIVDDAAPHDAIVHFAPETHVDRSIASVEPARTTNVLGMGILPDAALGQRTGRSLLFSSDEVYGMPTHVFPERLQDTFDWNTCRRDWWEPITRGFR